MVKLCSVLVPVLPPLATGHASTHVHAGSGRGIQDAARVYTAMRIRSARSRSTFGQCLIPLRPQGALERAVDGDNRLELCLGAGDYRKIVDSSTGPVRSNSQMADA